jgi:acetylornithine/succinyldiaminopimelate/putrescine aminotransferase/predicted amino acid dehydrogenase
MTASKLAAVQRDRGVRPGIDRDDLNLANGPNGHDTGAGRRIRRAQPKLDDLLKLSADIAARINGSAPLPAGSLEPHLVSGAAGREIGPEARQKDAGGVSLFKRDVYRKLGLDKEYVRAEGCYLFDADGNRYADFDAGAAIPFGHNPRSIWQAIEKFRQRSQPNGAARLDGVSHFAQRLLAMALPGLEHVVFANSGAEAVEAAMNLARRRTGRTGILVAGASHDLAGAPLSGSRECDPSPAPAVAYVGFGELDELEKALKTAPDRFAAVVVEPIQRESRLHVLPGGYLGAALELCHRFGTLLIVNEVHTGLGRTGTLFACQTEGVTPDVLVIGDALGGGLMPIGACLCTTAAYAEDSNAPGLNFRPTGLAGSAGLASLDELTRGDQKLVREVAAVGARLKQQLEQLQREFPMLVAAVRGRGFMLEVEFAFDHIGNTQSGMLAIIHSYGTLLEIVLSYLLGAHNIRFASCGYSSASRCGILIEPPLIADAAFCDRLTDALARALKALRDGDAGEILSHLLDGGHSGKRRTALGKLYNAFRRYEARVVFAHLLERVRPVRRTRPNGHNGSGVVHPSLPPRLPKEDECSRFAYVVHLLGPGDMRSFDPSLGRFTDVQVDEFRKSLDGFIKPFPLDKLVVYRPDGKFAEGELIMLPYLPAELLAMPGKRALEVVQSAVDLGVARGARVVGLGGFSSIISYGGNSLEKRAGVTITSGNSLTTWAAVRSVELACGEQGIDLAQCTVAIVGANGAIGDALSKFFAERAGELILVGNPRNPEASLRKLERVAKDCRRHVKRLATRGREFHPGSLAAHIAAQPAAENADIAEVTARMTLTTDIDQHLPRADIVLTATKEVLPFISSRHLRQGAVVCDVSRPFNVAPDVLRRQDLRLLGGGLIKAPDSSDLGYVEESDRPKVLLSCAAETIMLALSGYQSQHLCGRLDIDTVEEIGRYAERFGFSYVD